MISHAHRRLREGTQAHHQRLESRMDILNRIATTEGRRDLVERFYGLHAETEAAIAPWLATIHELDFDARRRSAQLVADAAVLGARPPQPAEPIRIGSVSEALGRMYVLEGSTLGGHVIRRAAAAASQDMAGLSFLDPYGDRVGERWRSFMAVIDAAIVSDADVEDVVAGAVDGFQAAEQRLCGDMACA